MPIKHNGKEKNGKKYAFELKALFIILTFSALCYCVSQKSNIDWALFLLTAIATALFGPKIFGSLKTKK
jgi:hypothetical protein